MGWGYMKFKGHTLGRTFIAQHDNILANDNQKSYEKCSFEKCEQITFICNN